MSETVQPNIVVEVNVNLVSIKISTQQLEDEMRGIEELFWFKTRKALEKELKARLSYLFSDRMVLHRKNVATDQNYGRLVFMFTVQEFVKLRALRSSIKKSFQDLIKTNYSSLHIKTDSLHMEFTQTKGFNLDMLTARQKMNHRTLYATLRRKIQKLQL
jgi:hypothetical protein